MSYPLVSIVTSSYNQAQFIEEAILSVIAQTYPNIEHIVIDGCSTDGTLDILKKYDDRLVCISEPDKGQYDAMNKGFKMAKGDILTWLNTDDILFSDDVVASVVNYFNNLPEVDIVYGDHVVIDERGKTLWKRKEIEFDPYVMLYGVDFIVPAAFFRRRVLDRIGFFDTSPQCSSTGDYEFWLRAMNDGTIKFKLLPKYLFGHRYQRNCMTVKQHEKMHEQVARLRAKYAKTSNSNLLLLLRLINVIRWQWLKLKQRHTIDNLLMSYISHHFPNIWLKFHG